MIMGLESSLFIIMFISCHIDISFESIISYHIITISYHIHSFTVPYAPHQLLTSIPKPSRTDPMNVVQAKYVIDYVMLCYVPSM